MRFFLLVFLLPIGLFAQQNVLQDLLNQNPKLFKEILDNQDKFQAQIIYTQIDRDENNQPSFTSYEVGVDESLYYYPASTVKMPTAFLALEKLNQLKIQGLDKHTPMRVGEGRSPQTPANVDVTAENLLPSVAHYVKKIFLVSDNDAQNRLYEFLGQADLNAALEAKGFTNSRIVHRLGISGFGIEDNRYTNPVSFYKDEQLLYHQGQVYSLDEREWDLKNAVRGKARMANDGKIVNEPFDFRTKNFVSLPNQHDILKTVLFPESVSASQRFDLTDSDYDFLYEVMSMLPKESKYPDYSGKEDDYVKFYMYGNTVEDTIPSNIRIFNKVGWAYGFLTDVSYFIDTENKVEFMVAANIHVNENETYNDGVYEYETIGLPFFGNLGKVLYEHELTRKRKHAPDFSRFNR